MTELLRRWVNNLDREHRYLFDERASIHEFDGGMPRHVAERRAQRWVCALIKRENDSALNEIGVPFSGCDDVH